MMSKPEEQLGELFSYKAEWLKERIFDLFQEPEYFPEMTAESPCVLIGGRGTGKTTVLRGLSYEGQFALSGSAVDTIHSAPFFGFYYKVNTNRVTAFAGNPVSDERWSRLFAHYMNLVLCDLVSKFLLWHRLHVPTVRDLGADVYAELAASLHMGQMSSVQEFASELRIALRKFEAEINNVADSQEIPLSMQGVPIDVLMAGMRNLPEFQGKMFFFLIDEYENFLDYQQQVVNTLIKHCSPLFSFKIGVRELGWRRKTTLNPNEQLVSPADYVRINISDRLAGNAFEKLAHDICTTRLLKLQQEEVLPITDIRQSLPGLTEDEEALRLGILDRLAELKLESHFSMPPHLSPLEQYFIYTLAQTRGVPESLVLSQELNSDGTWRDKFRFGNYKHTLLFTLRAGKSGIRKYYAGWDVFILLSAKNIRYLLELVNNSLSLHIREKKRLDTPVTQETQTKAAQTVGRKNISELEGLSVFGAQLTKLLLSLGRVFQVMAAQPFGHTPETNQFHLADEPPGSDTAITVERILTAAVMHMALLRSTGSKPADESDTREYDYSIHPIFSPFFVFSYRHKRKMILRNAELLGLVQSPQEAIKKILLINNRSSEESLPDQATLFEGFYGTTE